MKLSYDPNAIAPDLRAALSILSEEYPLVSEPLPIQTLSPAPELSFFLGRPEDGADTLGYTPASSSVAIGDEVMPGHVLGSAGDRGMRPSPVAGKVTAVRSTPDVRGGKPGLAVVIEVDAAAAAPAPAAEGDASAAPDAALEPGEPVVPACHQPREQVLQLRQFDLDLALARAGPAGEQVEDQL